MVVAHAFNPALKRQRQVALCEFKANLVYKTRTGSKATEKPCLEKPKKKKSQLVVDLNTQYCAVTAPRLPSTLILFTVLVILL